MKLPTSTFGSGLLLLLLPSVASAAVFSGGHADVIAVGYVDEGGGVFELEPHFHAEGAIIDGNPVADAEFEADEVTTLVPQSTFDYWTGISGRPADASWAQVGVEAGESFWFLPQSNGGPGGASTLGAPFAGIGTEELTDTEWSSPITIALDSVSGPGHFSVYLDGISPFFLMSSANGIDGSDAISIAAGSHEHFNWAFTAPGVYEIGVTISGTHVGDGPQQASATYTFQVVPEPGTALLGALSAGLLLRRRR